MTRDVKADNGKMSLHPTKFAGYVSDALTDLHVYWVLHWTERWNTDMVIGPLGLVNLMVYMLQNAVKILLSI